MLNRSKFLEQSELDSLKIGLKYDNRNDVLIRAMIELGARPQEILNIKQADLYTDSVLIHGLKGSRDREIPVSLEFMKALKRFVPFGVKYRRFAQIWDAYTLGDKTLKACRHTFAVNLYKKTKDIKLVQLALGHKSPTSTAVYTDFVYSVDELRKALAG